MAENQAQHYLFEKYQYGALARILASSEESQRYAPSALEVLAGEKGLNLGEEALGFIRGTQASEKGIATAINIYDGKFQEKRGEYSPADLAPWYDSVLKDIDQGDREKIIRYLAKHTESLKDINKKIKRALRIRKSQEDEDLKDEYTPEQVSQANDTIRKYQEIYNLVQTLDTYKFEQIRPDAVKATRKLELKSLASKL